MAAEPAASPGGKRSDGLRAGGMHATWEWTADGDLRVTLTAPTTGWLAIGFNGEGGGLKGARLCMAAVSKRGVLSVEEHEAVVPAHPKVATIDGGECSSGDGSTTVAFTVPRDPPRGRSSAGVQLHRGGRHHIVLAWSVAREFDHHSRFRTGMDVTLA